MEDVFTSNHVDTIKGREMTPRITFDNPTFRLRLELCHVIIHFYEFKASYQIENTIS